MTLQMEKEVEEYVEENYIEDITEKTVKQLIFAFEKALLVNSEKRQTNKPELFMESEIALNKAIKDLVIISEDKSFISMLIKLNTVESICSLFDHSNPDIAFSAIQLVNELTDAEDAHEQTEHLIESLIEQNIAKLLVNNLGRYDEEDSDDRQAVFESLGIFENILSVKPDLAEFILNGTNFLNFLLNRIKSKLNNSNRLYATEILSIFLQYSRSNRLKALNENAMEIILIQLSSFKKRDPADPDETELLENSFDLICLLLAEPEGKEKFIKDDAISLFILMLKHNRMARMGTFRTLTFACQSPDSSEICQLFVENGGLPYLFSALMGKGYSKYKAKYKSFSPDEETEYILQIISELLNNLTNESAVNRVFKKFDEEGKIDQLISQFNFYSKRLFPEVVKVVSESSYSGLLDKGLFKMQLIAVILCHLCIRSDKRLEIESKMKFDDLKLVLNEYLAHLDASEYKDKLEILASVL